MAASVPSRRKDGLQRSLHPSTIGVPRPRSRQHQLTRSEYVAVGSPEETVLETYFVMLSNMNFDKAREQCDREKEIKSASGGGTNWCNFITALSKLAHAESAYFNLSYMERSWSDSWRRKRETPKPTYYEGIIQELTKVHGVYVSLKGGTDIQWERKMADLILSIRDYLHARKAMIDFYLRFDQLIDGGFHIDFKSLERFLKEKVYERYKDGCEHAFLQPIKTILLREVTILQDLINAQQQMSEWQFLPAIISLQSAHSKLSSWRSIVPLGNQGDRVARALRHSRQISPPPQSSLPRLYKWICRLFTYLLAKFTLYFHTTLSEHSSIHDMKHLSSKLDRDYIVLMYTLSRQIQAHCVTLMFDSNGLPDFKGPKYSFPNSPSPVLTGINSYPFMVSIPHDFDFHHHRANIVSIIVSKSVALSSAPQVIPQHDDNLSCVYFLTQVDPRVTMVTICSSRGKDRDSKTISAINEFVNDIRPLNIALLLRNN